MELEVRHLRLVAAIAETGTVTKAGLVVHLSQSAVSHALRDIESRLRTQLFLRVGRRMVPTDAGRQLAQSAAEILRRLEEAEEQIKRHGHGGYGTLRLGTHCYTCYHWLPPVLEEYRRAHPHIRIEIKPDTAADPVGALLNGQLDVALAIGPIRNPLTVARHVFDETMCVVMSPKHRFATRTFIRPVDLQDETLLLHSPPSESFVYERVLGPAGVRPKGFEVVALTEAIVELAKAGHGVGVLADWAVTPHVKAGQLVSIPLTQRGIDREWFAVTLKACRDVAHLKDFAALVGDKSPVRQRRRLRIV